MGFKVGDRVTNEGFFGIGEVRLVYTRDPNLLRVDFAGYEDWFNADYLRAVPPAPEPKPGDFVLVDKSFARLIRINTDPAYIVDFGDGSEVQVGADELTPVAQAA